MTRTRTVGVPGLGVAILLLIAPISLADTRKWVAVEDLERHTCPSDDCGVVGRFFFRESVPVFETQADWSRVSMNKTAACFDGVSLYVETGPDQCSEQNGIREGEFAEWVRTEYLADLEPAQPKQPLSKSPDEG